MQNILTLIILAIAAPLSLMPAINFFIPLPNDNLWFWLILVAGFLGFYTLFINTNVFLKIIAIGAFVNCFFSAAPYVSFTAYISIVAGCYFYVLCSRIKDWQPIFRALQIILILNVFFIFMQSIGKDALLNFGLNEPVQKGIVGQKMQMGSLSAILAAMLISYSRLNFAIPILIGIYCNAQWGILCAGLGLLIYTYRKNKRAAISAFLAIIILFSFLAVKNKKLADLSRLNVWEKTISLALQKPAAGWGPGTYQYIFPALGMKKWKMAHNDFLQILFETGIPGLILAIAMFGWLSCRLIRTGKTLCLAGLTMLMMDMLVHFPARQIQCVPIMLMFLAYCEREIRSVERWQPQSLK